MNYDGDSDGWYDGNAFDLPALQGTWDNKIFTQSNEIIQPGPGSYRSPI